MDVTVHDVASELRRRLPAASPKKLHTLLYYCQGHHLAAVGKSLFADSIRTGDQGPVIGRLWLEEHSGTSVGTPNALSEAALNTVGYVVSRYGGMSAADLQRLIRSEGPWLRAAADRHTGESVTIEHSWLLDWFAQDVDDEVDALGPLDSDELRTWLAGAADRRTGGGVPDDIDKIRRRLTRAE